MPTLLLKLSGEALGGSAGAGLDPEFLDDLAKELGNVVATGARLAIVLGGGNIFRGGELAERGLDRVTGDRMGMLATVINGLGLADALNRGGLESAVYSAVGIGGIVPAYERNTVREAMDNGTVTVLCGGTGNPFFTTDTAACLRGIELGVDAVVKATNVDGIYDSDPRTNSAARRYDTVTYDEVLERELGVMDLTAIVLCKENKMPLFVCDVNEPGVLVQLANGGRVGTRVVA